MDLDGYDNLDIWPLMNIEAFVHYCNEEEIREVNLTGSNTDPLLYNHIRKLTDYLRKEIPHVQLGVRTNGALISRKRDLWKCFDRGSISTPTLNRTLYRKIMGRGNPPDVSHIMNSGDFYLNNRPPKLNIVLCPEIIENEDVLRTLGILSELTGCEKVNLREPYGQPHIGNPLEHLIPTHETFGMPSYHQRSERFPMCVTYWDVHWVGVESINLYASGRITDDYAITRGHSPNGTVQDQSNFLVSGRKQQQWRGIVK